MVDRWAEALERLAAHVALSAERMADWRTVIDFGTVEGRSLVEVGSRLVVAEMEVVKELVRMAEAAGK